MIIRWVPKWIDSLSLSPYPKDVIVLDEENLPLFLASIV
jgi:hypothetical protein